MTKEIAQAFGSVYEQINDMNKRLSDFTQIKVDEVTPYTDTKTAYIGDTDITFYNTPSGNLTVYFPYDYTVERLSDRVMIHFEPVDEVTKITISIL